MNTGTQVSTITTHDCPTLINQNTDPLRYEIIHPAVVSERRDGKEIRQILNHALSRLHELPSFRSLSIRFVEIVSSLSDLARIRRDASSLLNAPIPLCPSH